MPLLLAHFTIEARVNKRTLLAALPGVILAGLYGAGCGDAAAPASRVGGPDAWFHPPPPQLHLVLTVSPVGGTLDAPGCVLIPGVNTFSVTATVKDAANNTVSDIDGNTVGLTIEHDASGNILFPATLCGSISAIITGGVAQFPVLGVDMPALPGDGYTFRGHTDGAADGISPPLCVGACIE